MKNNQNKQTSKIICIAGLVLAGILRSLASGNAQNDPSVNGMGFSPNVGAFYAYAKMTNGTGLFYITPPSGTTSGTFTNASGFAAPFSASLMVIRKSDQQPWFTNSNHSLTFPASSSDSYMLATYVNTTTPPPTNGQPMTLQVTWH